MYVWEFFKRFTISNPCHDTLFYDLNEEEVYTADEVFSDLSAEERGQTKVKIEGNIVSFGDRRYKLIEPRDD